MSIGVASLRPSRPWSLRRAVPVFVASAALVISCARSGSEEFARLKEDPIFRVVPPDGSITSSAFLPGCTGESGTSELAAEVRFAFEGEQAAVADFYRSELPHQGWNIISDAPDLITRVFEAKKGIDDEIYLLIVTVGQGGGSLVGHAPAGTC